MPPSAAAKPEQVRIRMYNVGFGDCFLLSFEYASPLGDGRRDRQMLIDLGSTRRGVGGPSVGDIARKIAEHCNGKLDVVVVSHRHKDHLSGFGVKESAEIIRGLDPELIVRPWTEHPKAGAKAKKPFGELSARFAAHLAGEQESAGHVAKTIAAGALSAPTTAMLADLFAAAEEEVANPEALECLDGLSANDRGRYVHFGSDLQADVLRLIPGVGISVLGPPTPQQHQAVSRQRTEDKDQFWVGLRHLYSGSPAGMSHLLGRATPQDQGDALVGPRHWIVERMQRQHIGLAMELVRWLDDALNNTSVILLIKVAGKRLLFPGDAQIENWEYALGKADVRDELAKVDLYKVGHHGSRNATPKKGLFELWTQQTMTGLMSTRHGVHGKTEATRVPKVKLVEALRQRLTLYSTEEPEGVDYIETEIDRNIPGTPFRRVSH